MENWSQKMRLFPKQIFLPSQSSSVLKHSNSSSLKLTQHKFDTQNKERRRRTHLTMATLQKFKLLGLQCGSSRSPTRSPRVHLLRRKTTLKTLLSRRRREPTIWREHLLEKHSGDPVRRRSLKDLFQSSPPGDDDRVTNEEGHSVANPDLQRSGHGSGLHKPAWTGFRYRTLLSKKAWRPILLTIAE